MLISTSVPLPKVNTNTMYMADFFESVVTGLHKAKSVTSGTKTLSTNFNNNAGYLDILGIYGAGNIGVVGGLTPSAGTGLNATISAGTALFNGPIQKKTSSSVVVNASSTNYIWLSDAGVISVVDDSITPPLGDQVYLGAAIADGSGVTSIDLGGVVYILNGIPNREVGDTDQPVDSPPSTWRGFTKTVRATYYWDGTAYFILTKGNVPNNGYKSISGSKSDADYTLTASEYSNEIIKLGWTGWTGAKNLIVPTIAGSKWVIYNATGQTATVKTSAGTGIEIANTKHAIVYCDGTNIIRITGDT